MHRKNTLSFSPVLCSFCSLLVPLPLPLLYTLCKYLQASTGLKFRQHFINSCFHESDLFNNLLGCAKFIILMGLFTPDCTSLHCLYSLLCHLLLLTYLHLSFSFCCLHHVHINYSFVLSYEITQTVRDGLILHRWCYNIVHTFIQFCICSHSRPRSNEAVEPVLYGSQTGPMFFDCYLFKCATGFLNSAYGRINSPEY